MIGLDTNVLVRFLVADDPAQHRRAAAVFSNAVARKERLFVSQLVLCEMVWVLRYSYKTPRSRIVDILDRLLKASELVVESPDLLHRAVESFRSGRGDFADYLVRENAFAAGCDRVVTFDGELLRDPGFESP